MVTCAVLMLLSAKPNPRLSAPCIHTSHSLSFDTHILCGQMFVWPLIEPDQGTDPAEKEHRKKKLKNHTIFFFFPLDLFPVWVHCMGMQNALQEEFWGWPEGRREESSGD